MRVLFCSLLGIIVFSTAAFSAPDKSKLFDADEITEKKRVLNQRKTALRMRRAAMEKVGRYAGGLAKVQSDLLGANGLRWRLAGWQASFDSYMDQWSLLIDIMKTMNETNVSSKIDEFEKALVDTYDGFRGIEKAAQRHRRRTVEHQDYLATLAILPPENTALELTTSYEIEAKDNFRIDLENLNALRSTLGSSLNEIYQNLSPDYLAQFRESLSELRTLLANKVRILGLKFPELDEAINRAENLLKIMASTSDGLGKLKAEVFSFERMIDRSAIFRATSSWDSVVRLHESVKTTLDTIPGPEGLKKYSKELADSYLERARHLLTETKRSRTEIQLFQRFAKKQFRHITKLCKADMKTSEANCEGFRSISRTPLRSSTIRKRMEAGDLTREDLIFLEGKLIEFDYTWEDRK